MSYVYKLHYGTVLQHFTGFMTYSHTKWFRSLPYNITHVANIAAAGTFIGALLRFSCIYTCPQTASNEASSMDVDIITKVITPVKYCNTVP